MIRFVQKSINFSKIKHSFLAPPPDLCHLPQLDELLKSRRDFDFAKMGLANCQRRRRLLVGVGSRSHPVFVIFLVTTCFIRFATSLKDLRRFPNREKPVVIPALTTEQRQVADGLSGPILDIENKDPCMRFWEIPLGGICDQWASPEFSAKVFAISTKFSLNLTGTGLIEPGEIPLAAYKELSQLICVTARIRPPPPDHCILGTCGCNAEEVDAGSRCPIIPPPETLAQAECEARVQESVDELGLGIAGGLAHGSGAGSVILLLLCSVAALIVAAAPGW